MIKNIFLGILIAIAFTSCNKLNENPVSVITAAQSFQTQADAVAGVTAVYSELIYDAGEQPMYGRNINFLTDMTTDDLAAGPSAINPYVRALSADTYDASNDRVLAIWRQTYVGINRANVAVDKISAMTFDQTTRLRLVREAKFLRALYYFNLVRFFGAVPLVLHDATSVDITSLKTNQSTVTQVYQQIIADLTEAENLPATYTGADIGRATAGAAKSLLVKVYLTQKDWANTILKAKEVMNGGYGYALFANYADVFNKSAKNGKEHIFSAQFEANSGTGNTSTLMGASFTGFAGKVPADLPADTGVYNIFTAGDTRKAVTFYKTFTNPATGTKYTFASNYFRKYVDSTELSTPAQSGINFPILRYADVLLMYAEAVNETSGPTADAYNAINLVRNRANIGDLTAGLTQSAFRDALYLERRKEFVQEAQRWFDLVRTGRLVEAVSKVAAKTGVSTKNYLFPIPQSEISVNSGLIQNTGY
ncbi:RagB/SusD family nutrient uptake outer membrane protein [Pedobacter sp. L105]|uniref:RagB/SusD family nutrient uptake outer membrane protein n=1 Tax=Pedobacter sp. L105 TaxID=1641871 RepID=UPI00131A861F|nr:RagB/SusD family nutrient uptake outer membrane protein [Pedobacter sp. L105]